MKRREFIKKTSAIGLSGLVGQGCSSTMKNAGRTTEPGFDIHPFINNHPEAVFIVKTSIKSKKDFAEIKKVGLKLSREIIVKSKSGGFPNSKLITLKHNWHGKKKIDDLLAMNTEPNFTAGWVEGMKEAGPQRYYIYRAAELAEYFSESDYKSLIKKSDINFMKIPNGVVFNTMGQLALFNDPDAFLINIAKIKAHSMGITASVKNLQGVCIDSFIQFCIYHEQVRKRMGGKYNHCLQKNFENHIEELYAQHVKMGIPRWDKPGTNGGIWQEQWTQRMLDSFSVTPTKLNIVEGIYAMDGNGFGAGPHEKSPAGFTSRDYMNNVVIFGIDPFRVDIITHLMCGHEPGNFGLFHLGIERGMSDVLDPHDIPVYFWEDGQAVMTKLENLPRTPLRTLFLQRDYNGQNEPNYHLCNEPFDYSAWKAGERISESAPSIKELGRDAHDKIVMEVSLPKREHVYVDVLDRDGEIVGKLLADGELEPGTHQVVWDGFASPGIYNVYFKGMGWDASKQVVTYS